MPFALINRSCSPVACIVLASSPEITTKSKGSASVPAPLLADKFSFKTTSCILGLNLISAWETEKVKAKKQRAPKRQFSNTYKLQILNALDACKTGEERAALLRKEGLYYARVSTWKKQFQNGKFVANKAQKSVLLTQQLAREVASLKKKLSQAEVIIDIQKKVSELLSINILNHDTNENSL